MIRILIVDDQKAIRESIRALLAKEKDFQLVGTASDAYDAIAQVKDLQPDIILMDIEMPGVDGLEATKILTQQHPKLKILILTSHDQDDTIAQSLHAGAEGYLLKNMPPVEIIRAIRFVSQGYKSIKPTLGITANSNSLTNSISPTTSSLSNSNSFPLAKTNEERKLNSLRLATPNEFLPPIQNWLVISGLACVGIFIGAIALASQLKYKVTVKAPAKIRPLGEVRIVQTAIEGKIGSILVEENQPVRSGELIAQIEPTRLQSQKQQLLANIDQNQQQSTQLDEQLASIQAQTAAQQNLQQRTVASAQAQLKHQQRLYQQQSNTTQARVAEAEAAVELATEELNRYRELVQTGIVSQLQLKEKNAALKSSLAKLQQAKANLDPSVGEVAMAREQIAQEIARGETTLASLNRERQQLQERKIELDNQLNSYREDLKQIAIELENTQIRAPLVGTIQTLNLRNPGQVVRSGDEIATIAPDNSPLAVKAFVSAQDIGKVEIGQTTQMRVSACPYSDFGTLKGTVLAVSPDTKNSGDLQANIADASANYEISIQPENMSLQAGDWASPTLRDRNCAIRSGMEGRVDIISRQESILKFLQRTARLSF